MTNDSTAKFSSDAEPGPLRHVVEEAIVRGKELAVRQQKEQEEKERARIETERNALEILKKKAKPLIDELGALRDRARSDFLFEVTEQGHRLYIGTNIKKVRYPAKASRGGEPEKVYIIVDDSGINAYFGDVHSAESRRDLDEVARVLDQIAQEAARQGLLG